MSRVLLLKETYASGEQVRQRRQREWVTGFSSDGPAPWNVEDECKKFRIDPVERFAKPAGKFALVASAFARQPVIDALTSCASAIEALNATNSEEFNDHFGAWDANFKVALKRHQIEHEAYLKARDLMKTNVDLGNSEAVMNAARFDDQILSYLIENELLKEWHDVNDERQKLMLEIANHWPSFHMDRIRIHDLRVRGYDSKSFSNPANFRILREWKLDWSEFPPKSAEPIAEEKGDQEPAGQVNSGNESSHDRHESAPGEKFVVENFVVKAKETNGNQNASDQGVTGKARLRVVAPSEEARDDLAAKLGEYGAAVEHSDRAIKFLNDYMASADPAGKAVRARERLREILEMSSSTDREQFERDIDYLRRVAGRLLPQQQGRPLSAEERSFVRVIGNLDLDSTAVNARQYLLDARKACGTIRIGRTYDKILAEIDARHFGKRRHSSNEEIKKIESSILKDAPWLRDR